MNLVKLSYFLFICFFVTTITEAYCPPYFAKIDSIEPKYDCLDINDATAFCGGSVTVTNHCPEEYYFYNSEGVLDKNFVMVNTEDWKTDYQKYKTISAQNGIEYMGHSYRYEPSFDRSYCVTCPEGRYPCSPDEWIPKDVYVDGVNVCDEGKLEDGAVVKYWTIKIFSVETNEDIIVKGRTLYSKQGKFKKVLLYSIMAFYVLATILYVNRNKMHKRVYSMSHTFAVTLGTISLIMLFLAIISIG